MRTKERPHLTGGIDAAAVRSDKPLRKRSTAGPGMSASMHDVEHDGRVVGAMHVFAARDIRRHYRLDWLPSAAVSSRPVRGPNRNRRKGMRGDPRLTAVVKGEAIRSSMKRNHWDGSMFFTPAPRQCLSS